MIKPGQHTEGRVYLAYSFRGERVGHGQETWQQAAGTSAGREN